MTRRERDDHVDVGLVLCTRLDRKDRRCMIADGECEW